MKFLPILVLAAVSLPAATIDISAANSPAGETNVLIEKSEGSNSLTGTLVGFPGVTVNFTSTAGELVAPSNGQAKIESATGSLSNLTIALSGGYTFTDLIFNPFAGGNKNAGNVTVAATGTLTNATVTEPLSTGQNFMKVSANGQTIQSVTVSAPGLSELRQVRLSGVTGPAAVGDVPEPGTVGLMALGLVPLLLLRRKHS